MLYALEREWLPAYRTSWYTHPRLEFFMDAGILLVPRIIKRSS